MTHPSSDLLELETARAVVYRRLADAYRLPQADLMGRLKELAEAMAPLDSGSVEPALELVRLLEATADPTTLEVDFARLFAGPFLMLAPPYGSIYLEGARRLMGESTMAARDHYRHLGLDLAPEFKEAPDHIAAELEFLHVLVCQEVEAIQAGDRRLLLDSLRRQQTFLARHLGAWVAAFAAKVREHAATPFYRLLAEVTERFVTADHGALTALEPPLPAAAPLDA